MLTPLAALWLGRVPYADALRLQERLVSLRRRGRAHDTLLLLEHPPVITMGRGALPEHVLISPERREALGVELHESPRGGAVTYHGPGQLVGYPVIALREDARDAHRYLRDLEEVLIRTAADFGIAATRRAGLTGVWADGEKLAAIGVRIATGWITSHGFALNVSTDLSAFESIVPCGVAGLGVTSILKLTSRRVGVEAVAARAAIHVARVLGFRLEPFARPSSRRARRCARGELRPEAGA